MSVIHNNVWLYHYDESGQNNVTYHLALSGYELSYKEDGPFPNYYRIWAHEDGSVSDITIGPGGDMTIDAGAQCSDVTVLAAVGNISSPQLEVSGTAENVVASSIVRVEAGGVLNGVTVLEGGKTFAYNGSTVANGEVRKGGNLSLYLSSFGSNISVAPGGNLGVQSNSSVCNVTVSANGGISTLYGATVDTLSVEKGASCTLGDGTILKGTIKLAETPLLYGDIDAGSANVVFVLQDRTAADGAIISDWSKCAFASSAISISAKQENGLYLLAENASDNFSAGLYVADEEVGLLTNSNALGQGEEVYYIGYTRSGALAFVKDECSYVMLAQDDALASYVVVKSFDKAISIYADKDASLLLAGRKASASAWDGDVSYRMNEIADGSQCIQTLCDRLADVVVPVAAGVWGTEFCAFNANHGGYCAIAGKNRYDDAVWSGGDASLVMLSEDDDAFFADDIFTAMPKGIGAAESRLKGISEIRAGAGDDLIDLSMEHADDANHNAILRGGAGDDVLWGGNDGARMFGDSGNDELVGGAGNDLLAGGADDDLLIGLKGQNVYAFGEACGNDTVILTKEEDFRLWFDEGMVAKVAYDGGSALISIDGGASIAVTGAVADDLEERMIFGNADGAKFAGWDYDSLKELGAFDGDSSARNFNTLAAK